MADKVVKMQVTLTDGTIVDAGQFTVPEGPAGPEGPGINWKGTWVAGDEVFKDDAYYYQGSSYVANKDNAAGPPTPINPDWSLLAVQGAAGTDGAPGTPGTNGTDGVTPLENINIINLISVPTVNSAYSMRGSDFNRTPVTGDIAVLTVNYMARVFIGSFQCINYSGTMGSFQCKSVFELGVGIKSVTITEVAQ